MVVTEICSQTILSEPAPAGKLIMGRNIKHYFILCMHVVMHNYAATHFTSGS